MKRYLIWGNAPLKGEVKISGSKNSTLPIMAASLLTFEPCIIKNVPKLVDVFTMKELLEFLGKKVDFEDSTLKIIQKTTRPKFFAPYEIVSRMRASFCVLGPLLAKFKKAKVSFPGGCVIGVRPVDLHLKGLGFLGAKLKVESGYVIGRAKELRGNKIYLGGEFGSSVLATANVLMCAVLSKGKTLIENAACEPEIKDLANFLNKMGAKIKGAGTPWIEIEGVESLKGAEHAVIPDRIEAGTFVMAGSITRGRIIIKEAKSAHLGAVIDKLCECRAKLVVEDKRIEVLSSKKILAKNMTTLPFPGFPTDLQAQYVSLMSVAEGSCVVTERIFPDRFMHVSELNRMGAKIKRQGPHLLIEGRDSLSGTEVMASDLRASAALILAGLRAKGKTIVQRVYHLERGYENLKEKLEKLGAKIKIEK